MEKDRKLEHIQMAFDSQTGFPEQDRRFIYEPLLAAHPEKDSHPFSFLGKQMRAPLWVSSMTGGTGVAKNINRNLAQACREFGLGMGLGSCRKILFDKTYWEDFDVRDLIGPDQPFWANLGVAQVEQLLAKKEEQAIVDLIGNLNADGLIVHVNPLQEWFQPEGDHLTQPPLETIQQLMSRIQVPLIVKEVGQGMGRESLRELLKLPIEAIEFAAYGGTNFSKLEMMREDEALQTLHQPFAFVGQTAEQMLKDVNSLVDESEVACRSLIISGGVKNYLDGYYLVSKSKLPAVFGMASAVLKHATGDYKDLKIYIENLLSAYRMAEAYLRVNSAYEGQ
ncbi:beta/alpha barrel domain-containing protein [Mangrovibacterium diazotrophicum]|uniref:Isopentenyl-diphosphate delta-isomerase n=1 Tax=Mangrovibacterium diazotrophicum TaxID=1261403 RepID=A0A419W8D0_9BACT|nr:type 2 isopentenyl-diphosphate Delta-isomerase [Mangrovibacterium diazotrophicum]RKD91622.1 isopentenyl-diphosphate delta-isomerase [Mangrovibacterium diazotrophicum]